VGAVVAVVGSANIDHVVRLPHLPARGESVGGGDYLLAWGGKGANQAVAAARAGAATRFAACLGDDPLSRRMLADWAADGLDTGHVAVRPGLPTGTALVMVGGDGDNYLAVAPGTNHAFSPDDLRPELFAGAAVAVLQNEVPMAVNHRARELARQAGCRVIVNIAPACSADAWLLDADLVVVNESEATALAGHAVADAGQAEAAARTLRRRGAGAVLVTLGALGAVLLDADGPFLLNAHAVQAVDATAAGDTCCGALAAALADGTGLREACRYAMAAAALCVSRAGAQPSIPHRGETLALLGASR